MLKDTTSGWSHTIHQTSAQAKNASAEVIAEAPSSSSRILPLTNFGTVHFSSALVDGAAISKANGVKITMVNGSRPREGLGVRAQQRRELQREVAAQHLTVLAREGPLARLERPRFVAGRRPCLARAATPIVQV